MSADADEARGLTDYQLRDRIIEMAGRVDRNDGRLTADSSAGLDLAQDLLDAALTEYGRRDPRPPAIDAAHLERQYEFSRRTFGPGLRTQGVVDHIKKELKEILEHPTDVYEWADVIILGFDGALRAEHTPQEIIAAIVAKQTKNEGRTWPDWRTADPGKAIEHVREVTLMGTGERYIPPIDPYADGGDC